MQRGQLAKRLCIEGDVGVEESSELIMICVAHENQRLNNMYSFIKYIKYDRRTQRGEQGQEGYTAGVEGEV